MEINSILFYTFTSTALLGALFALLARRTMACIASAIVVFWALSGLYFILKLYYLAAVQVLIYGVAAAILLSFTVMFTNKEEDVKTSFRLGFKPVASLGLLMALGFFLFPFVLEILNTRNTPFGFGLKPFALEFFKSAFLPFELVSVLLLVALAGAAALIYRRKKG